MSKLIFLGCLSKKKYESTCHNAIKLIQSLDKEYQVYDDVPCCGSLLYHTSLKEEKAVINVLSHMLDEFKAAMFLCGCGNIKDLHNAPVVVTGWTLEYLGQRGFNVKDYAVSRETF